MPGLTTKQLLYHETTGALLPAFKTQASTRYYDLAGLPATATGDRRPVKIGEPAAMLGITTKQMLYRETTGALLPVFKSEGGIRHYDRAELESRTALIKIGTAAKIIGATTTRCATGKKRPTAAGR